MRSFSEWLYNLAAFIVDLALVALRWAFQPHGLNTLGTASLAAYAFAKANGAIVSVAHWQMYGLYATVGFWSASAYRRVQISGKVYAPGVDRLGWCMLALGLFMPDTSATPLRNYCLASAGVLLFYAHFGHRVQKARLKALVMLPAWTAFIVAGALGIIKPVAFMAAWHTNVGWLTLAGAAMLTAMIGGHLQYPPRPEQHYREVRSPHPHPARS